MNAGFSFSRWTWPCLAVLLTLATATKSLAAYAGDFTLTNHVTGKPTRLFDLTGSVLVLDFFSAQCTHCQASAPDIRTNIVEYYRAAGGNAGGVPVQVVSISELTNRVDTDLFIQTNALELVLDDTAAHSVFKQFGGVTYPHFVVVNAVTNGVNYPAWQVLGTLFGYTPGSTVTLMRGYINAVRGTIPPLIRSSRWSTNGAYEISFEAQRGRTNWFEASTNCLDWVPLQRVVGTNTLRVSDPSASQFQQRFYRIRVQ